MLLYVFVNVLLHLHGTFKNIEILMFIRSATFCHIQFRMHKKPVSFCVFQDRVYRFHVHSMLILPNMLRCFIRKSFCQYGNIRLWKFIGSVVLIIGKVHMGSRRTNAI